ncbi:NAD-glutamate dehydrogenase [Arthrobacter castelli]|uniref:NAD-glutamate dehydrogenase n=1 Tax=Arthrobacter castelli TaxID=271431 RepID=UPI00040DC06D|nr:NAD-glutamate dehydrogenase [Arthrobacter castelli]
MSSGSSLDQFTSGKSVESFISSYYAHMADEDARNFTPDELAERARFHYELAEQRRLGEAAIAIRDEPGCSVVAITTDDMPFLVDSVTAELVRQNAAIHMVLHPTFVATRNTGTSELIEVNDVPSTMGVSSGDTAALPSISHLVAEGDNASHVESWMSVEIDRVDEEKAEEIKAGLRRVLADVRASVEDWPDMRNKVREIADALDDVPGTDGVPDLQQAKDLLYWLDDGNFTFLGFREYELKSEDGEDVLVTKADSGLGMLRDKQHDRAVQHLTGAGREKAREKRALVITKANSRSTVHRAAYLDYIGVKRFDAEGNVDGERRFIGLFATTAYTASVRRIPIVRDKVGAVLRECGFPSDSHSGKDLLSIMETYPRDELFQITEEELTEVALSIMRLQERRRTRLFLRPDIYGRFMSALVYLPRDRYTTQVRLRIEEELRTTFDAEHIDYEARMSESSLARLFFRIRLPKGGEVPEVDQSELEDRLVRAARSWSEGISQVLNKEHDVEEASRLSSLWAEAFPPGYRVDYEVEDALGDIARFYELAREEESRKQEGGPEPLPILDVYIPDGVEEVPEDARLKLYLVEPKSLSQILPYFHNLDLEVTDERPFEVIRGDGEDFFLYDFGLKYPEGVGPMETADLLSEAFRAAVAGDSESDRFDRLVLREQIPWRQIALLRSYAKYMRQMGNNNSYRFMSDTLLANPQVTRGLLGLFAARFDPEVDEAARDETSSQVREDLSGQMEQVASLDADRVLRTFINLIEQSLRTNYYRDQRHLSVKFNPEGIEGLAYPRPKYEIWVYSPRVEGVHLRFGDVARGGLRWSDRQEDFRTEVLGLVKAQTVKNAIIIPTGAKGGFFAKQLPDPGADRNAWMEEGKESYRVFIRGLLDIVDNLEIRDDGEKVVPPERVVRHDDEDTYLVVAADKGTASFSDTANALAKEYEFWLGDAFASGGSVGYDHKAMGITAKGAWESVKRHFSELDHDSQAEDFTAVGIGDMSGDVFGNGMLLSRHVRLIAAFDHRHLFLDPDPDAASSFEERKRLFNLPRSTWDDYNKDLISSGGGVYQRFTKSIPISDQVRQALGIEDGVDAMSPPELIRAILKAPADLLYNGGIGTYVKASVETNADVGDKTNDSIRVNGGDLRVRVVGEGGNLGMTQQGRIEAARQDIILNTDAIDNSAGVDCSDHEVNIKIFVDRMVTAGKLKEADRADFLQSMTGEVERLVLRDNIDQNILLLNDKQRIEVTSPSFERLMDWLDTEADLNRDIENLPSTVELHERVEGGQGLTSPELSVLAAYAKIQLATVLTKSDLVDDPWFERTLADYFPEQLAERFGDDLQTHPLRREIIATVLANDMVNIGGITFAFRAIEETSVSESAVARAFVVMREVYDLDELLAELNSLPAGFPTEHWCAVHLDVRRLLDRAVRWYINQVHVGISVGEAVEMYKPLMDPLRRDLFEYLKGDDLARNEEWLQRASDWDLPESLGRRWAKLFESYALLDIARVSKDIDEPIEQIAKVYYTLYDRFGVDKLLDRITNLPRRDRWEALARAALREDLYSTVAEMTIAIMNTTGSEEGTDRGNSEARIERWEEINAEHLDRSRKMFNEVNRLDKDDIASLSVALRLLRSIVRR